MRQPKRFKPTAVVVSPQGMDRSEKFYLLALSPKDLQRAWRERSRWLDLDEEGDVLYGEIVCLAAALKLKGKAKYAPSIIVRARTEGICTLSIDVSKPHVLVLGVDDSAQGEDR